ncbi:hypothetical protein GWK47_034659 [Chionoecetes opilio]|uniref:Uncharacterized protein n=1 Tax=Chionoecetes opilio TaxID=41210 RepID=A0A8J4YFZ9_CHIOP|nr:hypothetical protein GWK47_034659 [Chionoecetes opilio]
MQSIAPGARDGKSPFHQKSFPSHPHLPQARCSQLGSNTPFSWKAEKKHLQESVNILGVEFDSGLTYTSHVKGRSPRMLPGNWGCIPRVAHLLDASGSRHTLQVTSPLLDGILAPRMVFPAPRHTSASLTRGQGRAQRL